MGYDKVCKRCGKFFVARGSTALFCDDCKHIAHVERCRKTNAAARQRKKSERLNPPKEILPVTEIAMKARAAGMTYGQYVAKYGEVEK